jgi:hypothetical protein
VHPRWTLDERIVESGYIPKCRAGSSDLNATRIPQHQVHRLFAGEQRTAIPKNRGSHDDPFISASSFRSDASSGAHCFLMKCLSAIQRVEMQRGALRCKRIQDQSKGRSLEANGSNSDSNTRVRHGCGMQRFDSGEARKVLRVERQDSLHSVDAHDRDKMSVMHLNAGDAIIH